MAESESKPDEARAQGGTIAQKLPSNAKPASAPLIAEAHALVGDADLPVYGN